MHKKQKKPTALNEFVHLDKICVKYGKIDGDLLIYANVSMGGMWVACGLLQKKRFFLKKQNYLFIRADFWSKGL